MLMADQFLEEDLICDTVIDEIIEEGLLDKFYEMQHVEDRWKCELFVVDYDAAHFHAEFWEIICDDFLEEG